MSESELITPNSLYAFYEQKKEQAITKEEENFFKKMFFCEKDAVSGGGLPVTPGSDFFAASPTLFSCTGAK